MNRVMMKRIFLICISISCLSLNAQDPWSLRQCVERAWEQNLDVQRSEMLLGISEFNLQQQRFSQLPSLNGGATHGYNWGQTIDPFTNEFATDRVRNNNLFLSSEMILFQGFQLRNSIKQSKLDMNLQYD